MPRKVVLTGRILSVEETARVLGVSPKRTREIVALMDAIMAKRDRAAQAAGRKKRGKSPKTPARRALRTRASTRHL